MESSYSMHGLKTELYMVQGLTAVQSFVSDGNPESWISCKTFTSENGCQQCQQKEVMNHYHCKLFADIC